MNYIAFHEKKCVGMLQFYPMKKKMGKVPFVLVSRYVTAELDHFHYRPLVTNRLVSFHGICKLTSSRIIINSNIIVLA